MRPLLLLTLALLGASFPLAAQADTALIARYGTVYPAADAALQPSPTRRHRVVFDLADATEQDSVNRGLWYLARLRNLLHAAGVPADSVELVGILHGGATALALTPEAYAARQTSGLEGESDRSDPVADLALMRTLAAHEVRFYVCAQSALGKGIDLDTELNALVTPALSAMTSMVVLREEGFVAF